VVGGSGYRRGGWGTQTRRTSPARPELSWRTRNTETAAQGRKGAAVAGQKRCLARRPCDAYWDGRDTGRPRPLAPGPTG
jgi:hypothetical protein